VVLAVYSSLIVLMASIGEGRGGSGSKSASVQNEVDPHVADLLRKLNLMEAEGKCAVFSDDEEGDAMVTDWALVGKVLTPGTLH
jgi:hypothetical protein